MIDLTIYGDQELSKQVFNETYFYFERKNRPYLMELIAEEFTHTPEQMTVLVADLDDDAQIGESGYDNGSQ